MVSSTPEIRDGKPVKRDLEMEQAKRWGVHGPETERDWENCSDCNYDRHACPGCGEWLYHGTGVCGVCKLLIKRGEM